MVRMNWTQRQLREENTVERLRQIEAYLEAEAKAQKSKTVVKLPDTKTETTPKDRMARGK